MLLVCEPLAVAAPDVDRQRNCCANHAHHCLLYRVRQQPTVYVDLRPLGEALRAKHRRAPAMHDIWRRDLWCWQSFDLLQNAFRIVQSVVIVVLSWIGWTPVNHIWRSADSEITERSGSTSQRPQSLHESNSNIRALKTNR